MGRLPKHYVLVASSAAGATIIQAVLVSLVSVVLIIQNSSCADSNLTLTADDYFMRLLKIQYFQDPACVTAIRPYEDLMSPSQVYVWMIVTLTFSLAWLAASIGVIIATDESAEMYFPAVSYTWSAITAAVTVVHAVLGLWFALDFSKLTSDLAELQAWNLEAYRIDLLRMGVFFLMTLAFKGFVFLIVNIVLIITVVMLAIGSRKILQTSQHSMHSQGPLNAYEAQKRLSYPWQTRQAYDQTYERSAQQNRGYIDSENISIPSLREQQHTDFPSRAIDRSDSWHHTSGPEYGSARPFSYLDEPRSPRSLPPPPVPAPVPSPAVVPPWRRDPWEQPPPVPAPDYSPFSGRRLKSALKH